MKSPFQFSRHIAQPYPQYQEYPNVPLPHLFCLLKWLRVCSLSFLYFKASIKWNFLLTSISTSLIIKCKINMRKREQNNNKIEICDSKSQFQPRCFPSPRCINSLYAGHCPQNLGRQLTSSYLKQNPLFSKKPAPLFFLQALTECLFQALS